MVGTAEKYVARLCSSRSKNVVGLNRPAMVIAAPGQQRRKHADHDPVDVKQRQDEQAVVVTGHREHVDHHAAHGIQVGVIEHDALGPAGRAAGVDQQGERVVAVLPGSTTAAAGPASVRSADSTAPAGPSNSSGVSTTSTFAPASSI